MRNTAPTPKVFNAKYKAPRSSGSNGAGIKSVRPLIIVGIVIVGGLLVTRLPFFQIKFVDVHNSPSQAVTDLARSLIGQSIFSNKIKIITHQVLEGHSELESFSCTRGLPATVRCEAVSREARFVWKSAGKSYLLDKSGFIFSEAVSQELPILEDRANKGVIIGEQVTSEETVAAYSEFLNQLKNYGITPAQLFITESFYQFGVVLSARTGQPFPSNPITILCTTSYPISSQISILNQVLNERSAQIKERIDLRVPGNVYFY